MDFLIPVVCALLLCGGVFFVVYPLLVEAAPSEVGGESSLWQERRFQVLSALKELEFDQAVGKIGSEDAGQVRQQLEAEALGVLGQLEARGQGGREGRLEEEILALRKGSGRVCAGCGQLPRPTDLFCPQCGTRFSGGTRG